MLAAGTFSPLSLERGRGGEVLPATKDDLDSQTKKDPPRGERLKRARARETMPAKRARTGLLVVCYLQH